MTTKSDISDYGFPRLRNVRKIVMQTIFVYTCGHNDLVLINIHEVERLSTNNVTLTDVCSDPGRIYNSLPK